MFIASERIRTSKPSSDKEQKGSDNNSNIDLTLSNEREKSVNSATNCISATNTVVGIQQEKQQPMNHVCDQEQAQQRNYFIPTPNPGRLFDITIPFLRIGEIKLFYLEVYRRFLNANYGLFNDDFTLFSLFPFKTKQIINDAKRRLAADIWNQRMSVVKDGDPESFNHLHHRHHHHFERGSPGAEQIGQPFMNKLVTPQKSDISDSHLQPEASVKHEHRASAPHPHLPRMPHRFFTLAESLLMHYFDALHVQFYAIIALAAQHVGHVATALLCIRQAKLIASILADPAAEAMQGYFPISVDRLKGIVMRNERSAARILRKLEWLQLWDEVEREGDKEVDEGNEIKDKAAENSEKKEKFTEKERHRDASENQTSRKTSVNNSSSSNPKASRKMQFSSISFLSFVQQLSIRASVELFLSTPITSMIEGCFLIEYIKGLFLVARFFHSKRKRNTSPVGNLASIIASSTPVEMHLYSLFSPIHSLAAHPTERVLFLSPSRERCPEWLKMMKDRMRIGKKNEKGKEIETEGNKSNENENDEKGKKADFEEKKRLNHNSNEKSSASSSKCLLDHDNSSIHTPSNISFDSLFSNLINENNSFSGTDSYQQRWPQKEPFQMVEVISSLASISNEIENQMQLKQQQEHQQQQQQQMQKQIQSGQISEKDMADNAQAVQQRSNIFVGEYSFLHKQKNDQRNLFSKGDALGTPQEQIPPFHQASQFHHPNFYRKSPSSSLMRLQHMYDPSCTFYSVPQSIPSLFSQKPLYAPSHPSDASYSMEQDRSHSRHSSSDLTFSSFRQNEHPPYPLYHSDPLYQKMLKRKMNIENKRVLAKMKKATKNFEGIDVKSPLSSDSHSVEFPENRAEEASSVQSDKNSFHVKQPNSFLPQNSNVPPSLSSFTSISSIPTNFSNPKPPKTMLLNSRLHLFFQVANQITQSQCAHCIKIHNDKLKQGFPFALLQEKRYNISTKPERIGFSSLRDEGIAKGRVQINEQEKIMDLSGAAEQDASKNHEISKTKNDFLNYVPNGKPTHQVDSHNSNIRLEDMSKDSFFTALFPTLFYQRSRHEEATKTFDSEERKRVTCVSNESSLSSLECKSSTTFNSTSMQTLSSFDSKQSVLSTIFSTLDGISVNSLLKEATRDANAATFTDLAELSDSFVKESESFLNPLKQGKFELGIEMLKTSDERREREKLKTDEPSNEKNDEKYSSFFYEESDSCNEEDTSDKRASDMEDAMDNDENDGKHQSRTQSSKSRKVKDLNNLSQANVLFPLPTPLEINHGENPSILQPRSSILPSFSSNPLRLLSKYRMDNLTRSAMISAYRMFKFSLSPNISAAAALSSGLNSTYYMLVSFAPLLLLMMKPIIRRRTLNDITKGEKKNKNNPGEERGKNESKSKGKEENPKSDQQQASSVVDYHQNSEKSVKGDEESFSNVDHLNEQMDSSSAKSDKNQKQGTENQIKEMQIKTICEDQQLATRSFQEDLKFPVFLTQNAVQSQQDSGTPIEHIHSPPIHHHAHPDFFGQHIHHSLTAQSSSAQTQRQMYSKSLTTSILPRQYEYFPSDLFTFSKLKLVTVIRSISRYQDLLVSFGAKKTQTLLCLADNVEGIDEADFKNAISNEKMKEGSEYNAIQQILDKINNTPDSDCDTDIISCVSDSETENETEKSIDGASCNHEKEQTIKTSTSLRFNPLSSLYCKDPKIPVGKKVTAEICLFEDIFPDSNDQNDIFSINADSHTENMSNSPKVEKMDNEVEKVNSINSTEPSAKANASSTVVATDSTANFDERKTTENYQRKDNNFDSSQKSKQKGFTCDCGCFIPFDDEMYEASFLIEQPEIFTGKFDVSNSSANEFSSDSPSSAKNSDETTISIGEDAQEMEDVVSNELGSTGTIIPINLSSFSKWRQTHPSAPASAVEFVQKSFDSVTNYQRRSPSSVVALKGLETVLDRIIFQIRKNAEQKQQHKEEETKDSKTGNESKEKSSTVSAKKEDDNVKESASTHLSYLKDENSDTVSINANPTKNKSSSSTPSSESLLTEDPIKISTIESSATSSSSSNSQNIELPPLSTLIRTGFSSFLSEMTQYLDKGSDATENLPLPPSFSSKSITAPSPKLVVNVFLLSSLAFSSVIFPLVNAYSAALVTAVDVVRLVLKKLRQTGILSFATGPVHFFSILFPAYVFRYLLTRRKQGNTKSEQKDASNKLKIDSKESQDIDHNVDDQKDGQQTSCSDQNVFLVKSHSLLRSSFQAFFVITQLMNHFGSDQAIRPSFENAIEFWKEFLSDYEDEENEIEKEMKNCVNEHSECDEKSVFNLPFASIPLHSLLSQKFVNTVRFYLDHYKHISLVIKNVPAEVPLEEVMKPGDIVAIHTGKLNVMEESPFPARGPKRNIERNERMERNESNEQKASFSLSNDGKFANAPNSPFFNRNNFLSQKSYSHLPPSPASSSFSASLITLPRSIEESSLHFASLMRNQKNTQSTPTTLKDSIPSSSLNGFSASNSIEGNQTKGEQQTLNESSSEPSHQVSNSEGENTREHEVGEEVAAVANPYDDEDATEDEEAVILRIKQSNRRLRKKEKEKSRTEDSDFRLDSDEEEILKLLEDEDDNQKDRRAGMADALTGIDEDDEDSEFQKDEQFEKEEMEKEKRKKKRKILRELLKKYSEKRVNKKRRKVDEDESDDQQNGEESSSSETNNSSCEGKKSKKASRKKTDKAESFNYPSIATAMSPFSFQNMYGYPTPNLNASFLSSSSQFKSLPDFPAHNTLQKNGPSSSFSQNAFTPSPFTPFLISHTKELQKSNVLHSTQPSTSTSTSPAVSPASEINSQLEQKSTPQSFSKSQPSFGLNQSDSFPSNIHPSIASAASLSAHSIPANVPPVPLQVPKLFRTQMGYQQSTGASQTQPPLSAYQMFDAPAQQQNTAGMPLSYIPADNASYSYSLIPYESEGYENPRDEQGSFEEGYENEANSRSESRRLENFSFPSASSSTSSFSNALSYAPSIHSASQFPSQQFQQSSSLSQSQLRMMSVDSETQPYQMSTPFDEFDERGSASPSADFNPDFFDVEFGDLLTSSFSSLM
ncbi:uncharacterized protein MONOS_12918 [Monocercomonoides exilis]|uniref:uncharacterized protein n=1 Tax=Monocercomonoides exilis TaxID=2049356 RepID=UPI003559C0A2|nr:hypothetical protein MONOS_12918 [Monocercomonoides exilis]|eukprot:MONOS_12918.1-p1 / transcript=MONOS_12918.1 / gene=MONOS_12918 / organism=Monocercomonoides_exilis_PA203 / gene_product=unspecified product / transcript_product=unspecified product / location=Mono_scaffold00752:13905-23196(-) / protein_length=3048 / sequence_SO=supercontig / SO=protein_coding / is_pseudo=false